MCITPVDKFRKYRVRQNSYAIHNHFVIILKYKIDLFYTSNPLNINIFVIIKRLLSPIDNFVTCQYNPFNVM